MPGETLILIEERLNTLRGPIVKEADSEEDARALKRMKDPFLGPSTPTATLHGAARHLSFSKLVSFFLYKIVVRNVKFMSF